MLATPQYQIRKDKKSGVLVSPSKFTVVGLVDTFLEELEDQGSVHAHSQAGSSYEPDSVPQTFQ